MPSIIGSPVRRREDPRLITGHGLYSADVQLAGLLHAVFVRSPLPHARITTMDVEAARAVPGVVGAFTAEDLGLDPHFQLALYAPDLAHPPLSQGTVRYVGDPVAVVLGESLAAAVDGAAALAVDYDPLPALIDLDAAAAGDPLFEGFPTNVVLGSELGDGDALEGAEVVVKGRVLHRRLAAVPMETNAITAAPDPETAGLKCWVSTQVPHRVRDDIAAFTGLKESEVRVIAPDVGGGFGAKLYPYGEHLVVAALARRLSRPVRWMETRSESFTALNHGRAQVHDFEIGASRDGRVNGFKVAVTADCGAYAGSAGFIPHYTTLMMSGVYRIPKIHATWRSVLTNTTPTGAYRGAGRPEAATTVERAMDMLAAELGMDPAELRRRNLIPADAFPYTTPMGATYDSGQYEKALDLVLEVSGYAERRREQAERRARGDRVLLGIGISTYVEITAGVTPTEFGGAELRPDGSVVVSVGTASQGQGHETALAQIAAETLGLPMERIAVAEGDTAAAPRGDGTSASRSMQLGGSAVMQAAVQLREKARELAAEVLEADAADIEEPEPGVFGVRGVPGRTVGWTEIAAAAHAPGREAPGLSAQTDFLADPSFPSGAHVAIVEVDSETGHVALIDLVAVDDCGRIINPLIAEGQVHGGAAQGVAAALHEEVVYNDEGVPLTTSLLDYGMPTIGELPVMRTAHVESPSPNNPLGAKGIGESGTIGATPAVQSAVLDALAPLGIRHLDIPLTPDRVWKAIAEAGKPRT